MSSGPHGKGDPDDRSLRKVEKEVLVPKIMRDRARVEKCCKEADEFEACCKGSKLLMVIKCRRENSKLKECLTNWYENEQFRSECTELYLKERTEYRRTGIPKKHREQNATI